jgi:hypothetical protein
MELTETRIAGASKWMRSSEGPGARIATRWLELQVCLDNVQHPWFQEPGQLPYSWRVL